MNPLDDVTIRRLGPNEAAACVEPLAEVLIERGDVAKARNVSRARSGLFREGRPWV